MHRSTPDSHPTGPKALAVLTAIAVVASLYLAQELLVPLTLAVLLAFFLAPAVRRLERWRFPRVFAVVVVTVIAFGVIASVGGIVGQQLYKLTEDLPRYQDEIVKKAHALSSTGGGVGARIGQLGEAIRRAAGGDSNSATTKPLGSSGNPLYTIVASTGSSSLQAIAGYLGLALGPVGTAAVVMVLVVFILLQREDMRDRIIRLVSRGRYIVTTEAINDGAQRVSRYVLMQSLINGSIGLTIGTGLWIIGLTMGHGMGFPSFMLWGLLCAMLRFVPYLGPWVAAIFPVTVSLAVFPGFSVFFAVIGLIITIELISNNVFEPWLYGSSTGLSAVAVLVAAVFWTWLWGPIGLLLSTPLTVCIVVLGKYVPQFAFLDILLSDSPALPPPVSFYQRLLAGDEREAREVVAAVAKEFGPNEVYDKVLVPALQLTRRDRMHRDLSAENERRIFQAVAHEICPSDNSDCTPDFASDDAPPTPAAAVEGTHRVLFVPAHHTVEELTLKMLENVIACPTCQVKLLSTRMLPSEIEDQVVRDQPELVVLSVLPPGGLTQARFLCRRLRRQHGDLRIIVQYLGKPRDYDRLLVRLRRAGATTATTSILQTAGLIRSMLSLRDEKPAGQSPSQPAAASVDA